MAVTRRAFLAGCTAVLGAAWAGLPVPGRASAAAQRHLIVGSDQSVCAINLTSKQAVAVPVGFKAHGFAQHPLRPERVWAFEKWGVNAAEIDFAAGAVTQKLTSPDNTQFFGHGLFARDGETLFAVREDFATGQGHCIGFDTQHYRQVADIQATPGGLHECHLLPDGTFLVASNGAPVTFYNGMMEDRPMVERSALVHVDPTKSAVLDKKFVTDDDQIVGHFAIAQSGALIVLAGPRRAAKRPSGAIYYGHIDRPELRRVVWDDALDKQLRGEMLSVAINEHEQAAVVTNPGSSRMFFVDIRDGSLIGVLDNRANGVVFDETLGRFLASISTLVLVNNSADKPEPVALHTADGKGFTSQLNGAHSIIASFAV